MSGKISKCVALYSCGTGHSLRSIATLICISVTLTAQAKAQFEPGMAVASCEGQTTADVVIGIKDIRNPSLTGGVLGQPWDDTPPVNNSSDTAPMIAGWTRAQLGQVFGIAIGKSPGAGAGPDIFTSTTDVYSGSNSTNYPHGRHTIFRLRPQGGLSLGTYEVFHQVASVGALNNQTTSLGQITYNKVDQVLYASNRDDGNIAVISDQTALTGTIIGTFNHGTEKANAGYLPAISDNTADALTAPGRRVWAVQYNEFENRLYYAVNESNSQNTIWSVPVLSGGWPIMNQIRREFSITNTYDAAGNFHYPNEIFDIAFTSDGQSLMVAERYFDHVGSEIGQRHRTRVLHYTGATSSWTPEATDNRQRIGRNNNGGFQNYNSAGGVDYSYEYLGDESDIDPTKPEGRILATGDALNIFSTSPPPRVYGIQSTARADRFNPFSLNDHYFVDLDGDVANFAAKTRIGDVEAYRINQTVSPATLKVCKVAGEGVDIGALFDFNVSGISAPVSVPAGPAPGGYCKVVEGGFSPGNLVTVDELEPPGHVVTDISIDGSGQILSSNLDDGIVEVELGDGVTELTYTNEKRTGYLEICKWGDVDGEFVFEIQPGNIRTTPIPSRACTPAIEVSAGTVTITELPSAGSTMTGCLAYPAGRAISCSLADNEFVVNVPVGSISTQTLAVIGNVESSDGRARSKRRNKNKRPPSPFEFISDESSNDRRRRR